MCTCVMYLRSAPLLSKMMRASSAPSTLSVFASASALSRSSRCSVFSPASSSTCSYAAGLETDRMMNAQNSYSTHAAHSTQICRHVSTTRSNMSNSTCRFSTLLTTTKTVYNRHRLKNAIISFMVYDML